MVYGRTQSHVMQVHSEECTTDDVNPAPSAQSPLLCHGGKYWAATIAHLMMWWSISISPTPACSSHILIAGNTLYTSFFVSPLKNLR